MTVLSDHKEKLINLFKDLFDRQLPEVEAIIIGDVFRLINAQRRKTAIIMENIEAVINTIEGLAPADKTLLVLACTDACGAAVEMLKIGEISTALTKDDFITAFTRNLTASIDQVNEIAKKHKQLEDLVKSLTASQTTSLPADENLFALQPATVSKKTDLKPKQVDDIKSMYRNLFQAATSKGQEFIALPAPSSEDFDNDPKPHFKALMEIANDFPLLNIIYHAGAPNNAKIFDSLLKKKYPANIANLVRTDLDVLVVANELTRQGKPCAFYNPNPNTITLQQVIMSIAKVRSLDGRLASTRFLPFEKIDKKTKEDKIHQFMEELLRVNNPIEFQTKLIKLFEAACIVRTWLSSETHSTNTHSASVLRDQILRSPDILKILGIDESLNKEAKDSALKKLMEAAYTTDKAAIIQWEKDPPTSRTPKM